MRKLTAPLARIQSERRDKGPFARILTALRPSRPARHHEDQHKVLIQRQEIAYKAPSVSILERALPAKNTRFKPLNRP